MEQLINTINNPWFFFALAGTFGLYLLTLSVVLTVWTARDIRKRSTNQAARILFPVFVMVFGFAGFVPYLALRPRQTFVERLEERRERMLLVEAAKKLECPTCFAAVQSDFAFCPACHADFKPVCSCTAVLDVTWKRCPFCGSEVSAELKSKKYAVPLIAEELRGAYLGDTTDIKKIEAEAKKLAKTKKNEKPVVVATKPAFVIKAPKPVALAKSIVTKTSAPKPVVTKLVEVSTKNTDKDAKPLPAVKLTGFSSLFKRAFAIKR